MAYCTMISSCAHGLLHDDIGEAAGRNDVHHSVSDVYITSINHWVEMQHSRTTVLSLPLFSRDSTRASLLQRQKLIYPATAQTPCRNCRLGDNSSESIPVSLLSLSLSRLSWVRMTMRSIPSGSRPRRSSTESMTQLPLLQSRSHACLQAAVLLVARGDFIVWPFESSRAFRLLGLYQHPS